MSDRRSPSRRQRMLGQGMTEYLVIVALIGVAAIGAYSFLGQSIRGATAGLALEIAGEAATEGITAASQASQKSVATANRRATLNSYHNDNR